jgi:hypothetical protein
MGRVTAWPEDVPFNPRILSAWDDSLLRLRDERGVERIINLEKVPLPANRSSGGPFDHGLTLGQFPHWLDVARAHLALSLNEYSGHDALDTAINGLNHVLRFFAWCVEQRVYKLSALRPQDLEEFAVALRPHGWFSALSVPERLDQIVERAGKDTHILNSIVSVKNRVCSVSPDALSREMGFVITSREFPVGFREAMAALTGYPPHRSRKATKSREGWSESSFKNCFTALNRLAHLPDALDRLDFEPFPNARKHARQSGGRPDGRTRNLPIEEAAKLLGLALKWIYERSDGVVELMNVWRDALGEARYRWCSAEDIQIFATQRLREAYPAIQAKYGLPGQLTGAVRAGGGEGDTSVVELIQDLQTAAMIIVGINQGRRKNEVLGEGSRPWGLYLGCMLPSDPFVDAHELDIYIEKTWRNWMRMSTNKLTVDAIRVLERLRLAIYPQEKEDSGLSAEELRRRKLFVFPTFRVLLGEDIAPYQYAFGNHSVRFFKEAGVGEEARRSHSFRRFFALIYVYRWEHPLLQALSEYLCHMDMESTRVYVTDPSMREEAERIEKVYRLRADCFPFEELTEAQRQYADDLLRAMLTSTSAGGPMARRVRQWVKRLARRVEFADADLDEALAAVRSSVDRRGYMPTSFRHGACWASGDRMARRARCGSGGKLHREQADIGICSTCPFHSTSEAFLRNVEQEAMELEAQAKATVDAVEREATLRASRRLLELIDLERELMARYRPLNQPASPGRTTS